MKPAFRAAPFAIALGIASAATAQSVPEALRGTAADPGSGAARLSYQSPFARYRPYADGEVAPWKSVNDEVARIGGWKTYLRESQEGAASPSSAPESGAPGEARPKPAGDAAPRPGPP